MTSDSLGLDPEVRELLLDIARDKDSTLLRVPGSKLQKYTATGGQADRTSLSSAEGHLIQTHRVEVALALRRLCRARLWEHPEARLHLMRPVTRTTFFEVPTQATSVARGLQALEPIRTVDEASGVAELLEACIQPTDGAGPSTTQLAAASLRLEPTDQARIYCAIESKYEDDPDNGIRILRSVLGSRPSRELEAYALTNLGSIETGRSNWRVAFEAYDRAAVLMNDRPAPLMSGMLASAFASETVRGRALAERIDEKYDEHHPAVVSFSIILAGQFSADPLAATQTEASFLSDLAGRPQGATARILNEVYS